jgi:hypothetical protein
MGFVFPGTLAHRRSGAPGGTCTRNRRADNAVLYDSATGAWKIIRLNQRPLYKTPAPDSDHRMDFENPVVWIVAGLILLGVAVTFVAPRFSAEARLERRRRKNNARVINKSGRPAVKLSVRTKKGK